MPPREAAHPELLPMITIVDYGMGNLRSVQKAFESVGAEAFITSDPAEVERASKVVLPGVGAFADTMAGLREHALIDPLCDAALDERPFLGICIGLQVLFSVSYERGEHRGLDVIPGKVVQFKATEQYKVPHIGWNSIIPRKEVSLLEGLPERPYMYFVHSFHVVPENPSVIATETDYDGLFTSMIARGNLFATQFHPEKSQKLGLQILKNFVDLHAG